MTDEIYNLIESKTEERRRAKISPHCVPFLTLLRESKIEEKTLRTILNQLFTAGRIKSYRAINDIMIYPTKDQTK